MTCVKRFDVSIRSIDRACCYVDCVNVPFQDNMFVVVSDGKHATHLRCVSVTQCLLYFIIANRPLEASDNLLCVKFINIFLYLSEILGVVKYTQKQNNILLT